MGKHTKGGNAAGADAGEKKLMKPAHAAQLLKKNARTIAKMVQILVSKQTTFMSRNI